MGRNPYVSANTFISKQSNCGPLSLTNRDGTPRRANMAFNMAITLDAVVVLSFWISTYREK